MIDKNKSVARSRAGSALVTVSGIVLFFGIVATVILVIASIVSNDFYEIATIIEVLFGSIFVYVFGKTVARIADYAEAMYKHQNPDYKYDCVIEAGARFMPGDKAIFNMGQDDEATVTIKDVKYDDGYFHFICIMPSGEEKEVENLQLFDIDVE